MIVKKKLGIKICLALCMNWLLSFTVLALENENKIYIAVCGQIAEPRVIVVNKEITIEQALKICRGFTEIASRRLFQISRIDITGERSWISIDMREKTYDKNKEFVLRDGDMIMVYDKFNWNEYKTEKERIQKIVEKR